MLQHLHHVETAKSTLSQNSMLRRTPSPIFKIPKQPSAEKFKNNYFLKKVTNEHLKNFEKCKKRIQDMNNKNKTTVPALFFRRVDKSLINKTCPISNQF